MKNYKILLILIIVIIQSCERKNLSDNISGIWIFDREISNQFLNNEDGYLGMQYPIIYDFKKGGTLIMKNYLFKDTTFSLHWTIINDSLLIVDNIEYIVHGINEDSISFISIKDSDSIWSIYRRPMDIKFDVNEQFISKILTSNIWTAEDLEKYSWANHFEYFDNGTMVYRNRIFDKILQDSIDNLQLENWAIAKYDNYYFLYGIDDPFRNRGNFDYFNQIVSINNTSFSLQENYEGNSKEMSYKAKKPIENWKILHENIIGQWLSKNSNKRTYGKYGPDRLFKNGILALFEGNLIFEIDYDKLIYRLDSLKPRLCNWTLGKDAKTLILEYSIDNGPINDTYFECINILNLTDSRMKVRLFDYSFETDLEKPKEYYLNLIQEFVKEKN